jgi:hypothetical protein
MDRATHEIEPHQQSDEQFVKWRVSRITSPLGRQVQRLRVEAGERGGRFHPPPWVYDRAPEELYSVLYLSTKYGALREKLQDVRPNLAYIASLNGRSPDEIEHLRHNRAALREYALKPEWLQAHGYIEFNYLLHGELFDIQAYQNVDKLCADPYLAAIAIKNKHKDISPISIMGDDYELPQETSYIVRQYRRDDGTPRYCGISYPSHLGQPAPCLALFMDRISILGYTIHPLTLNDPLLQQLKEDWDLLF